MIRFIEYIAVAGILLCCLFSSNEAEAQPWNTARLSVIEGGTVEFNFNSFNEYENGITSTNGTVLGITIANLAAGSALASWTLDFATDLGATDFTGPGTNTLDLSTIQLTASENFGFAGETVTFSGPLALTAASQTLVSTSDTDLLNIDWTTHQVNITYDCGTTAGNNLLEETPGYYTVEIEFTLEPGF